jgi:hypothetical protein
VESVTFSYVLTRFVALANPNVVFVDHWQYVANEYESLDKSDRGCVLPE